MVSSACRCVGEEWGGIGVEWGGEAVSVSEAVSVIVT